MSTLNVNNITNGTDSIDVSDTYRGVAKAWCTVQNDGTVLASFNISSTVDIDGINKTFTFTNAMSSGNYTVTVNCNDDTNTVYKVKSINATDFTVSGLQANVDDPGWIGADSGVSVVVHSLG